MDRLKAAIDAALPLLRSLDNGLTAPPSASTGALARLESIAARPRGPASKATEGTEMTEGTIAVVDSTSPSLIPSRTWTLDELRDAALRCIECPHLASTRSQVVFGVGNPSAELMFVGEAPGADEDREGEPFVGKAGQLLTKIIQTMGFSRDSVYIANVLKCRPDMPPGSTGNRKPRPAEMATCLPWLEEQIRLIAPKIIVALGATAVEGLLGEKRPMHELRGTWLEHAGIPVMVTYHPAYLLRNQSLAEKRKVWEDMLRVLEKLGAPISEKQRGYFT